MNKAIYILILAIALGGCGRDKKRDTGEFESYVKAFEADSDAFGHSVRVQDIVIKRGPMDNAAERGICVKADDQPNTILINGDAYDRMSETEKKALLYHELGHCVLDRTHDTTTDSSGKPESLMNPYMLAKDLFEKHESYYVGELFQKAQIQIAH